MGINIDKFPYSNIRDQQKVVLEKLKANWDNYRYFILELPVGSGKSGIAVNICNSNTNAFLITATKQLQDQYKDEFKREHLVSIKGKANYQCNYNDKLNCEIGPCMVNKDLLKDCIRDDVCPYYKTRDRALRANIALTSYQYFLRSTECSKFWKKRDILILDECHLLEQQITQWAGIFLDPKELHEKYEIFEGVAFDKFVVLSIPPETAGYEDNKMWLNYIWDLITKKRLKLYEEIKVVLNGKDPDDLNEEELDSIAATHKEYYDIDKLFKRMHVFYQSNNKDTWIIEPENGGLTIQPVSIGRLFKQYVDLWATKKVVFMSATILDIKGFCEQVGIPREQTAVIRMESTFPPERSPIVYYPAGPMNYANIDNTIPKIIKVVEDILEKHPGEKGIIHTGNYKIAKAICEGINNNRLIMREEKESNEMLLKRHTKSIKPTVLVSPSLTTGADLKDDLSRFQIMVKMPWPSLADKRIQKKIKLDNNWYVAEMFRSFLQAAGRSTRSEKDWSTTYVLDSSFYQWTYKFRKWFPKQYLKRIVWNKDKHINVNVEEG
jgi:ATP-dependent DNA helicase DinG